MILLSKCWFRQHTWQTESPCRQETMFSYKLFTSWWIQGLSRTCVMKFKDFQAPVLFSSTFKALNLWGKNSSTFKDFQGCVGTCPPQCLMSRHPLWTNTVPLDKNVVVWSLEVGYSGQSVTWWTLQSSNLVLTFLGGCGVRWTTTILVKASVPQIYTWVQTMSHIVNEWPCFLTMIYKDFTLPTLTQTTCWNKTR